MGDEPPTIADLMSALRDLRTRLERLEQAAAQLQQEARAEQPVPEAPAVTPPPSPPPPPLRPPAYPPTLDEQLRRIGEMPQADKIEPWIPVEPTVAAVEGPPPVTEVAKPRRAGMGLEQQIGTRWMLIVGVVVLLLAAVFFFKYAFEQGWISKQVRVLAGAGLGLALIGMGEWAFRRRLRLWAAGVIGCGVVMLYLVTFVACPNGLYKLIDAKTGFALMCAVTVIGAVMSLHTAISATAIIALIGAFATPIMLSTGQNQEMLLMSYLMVVDVGFLIIAMIRRWQVLAPLALLGTIVLYAGWYEEFGPPVLDAFPWAFFAVFIAWSVYSHLAARARQQLSIAVTVVAAVMLGLLWCGMKFSEAGLAWRLIGMEAILLAAALWLRWRVLAVLAMGGAIFLYPRHDLHLGWVPSDLWAWVMYAMFPAYAMTATALKRTSQHAGQALIAVGAVAVICLWLNMDMEETEFCIRLLALDFIVLAACMLRRWNWCRAVALGWTAAGLCALWYRMQVYPVAGSGGPVLSEMRRTSDLVLSRWIWGFFALFTADVLVRAWRRGLQTIEKLDACLATAAIAAMFASTYGLLDQYYDRWMGTYTAALGAAALAIAWLVHGKAGRRVLGYAFLAQGLALVTLAVPIQFDWAAVTIAWAAEGMVAMFLAKRLGSRLVLVLSPIALVLAVGHFIAKTLPDDPRMAEIAVTVGGVGISQGLLLAAGLTAAILAAVAIMRSGRDIGLQREELYLGVVLTIGAVLLYAARTAIELPPLAASGWWLVLGAGLTAVAAWRRSRWLYAIGASALVIIACKWLLFDTLHRRLEHGSDIWRTVIVNWQLGIGVTTGLALLAASRWFGLAGAKPLERDRSWRIPLVLLGLLVFLWAGSFEVDRYFASAGQMPNRGQAMQMAYSLWWAVYATVLLTVGFVIVNPAIRYMSLVIFGVTIGKVFLVDMRDVEAVYRIASFLGLGLLLLGASLLYHRSLARKTA